MKYVRLLLFCLSIVLIRGELPAQDTNAIYKVIKSSTGQSFLLAQTNAGAMLHTDLYIRIGTIYEMDSVSGISLVITKVIDSHVKRAISGRAVSYYSITDPEQLSFHFESSKADLDFILTVINDHVINGRFDTASIAAAQSAIYQDIERISHDEKSAARLKIMSYLWSKDFKRINIYGDGVRYKVITPQQCAAYRSRYFLPLNTAVMITGSLDQRDVMEKLEKAFKDFKSKEFNPELINRILDIKPIIYSAQVAAGGSDTALITLSYQGPGARQNRSATYAAFMLSALISDQNGTIARAVLDSNITSLKASFECNNFFGMLTISARVLGHNYNYAFARLDSAIGRFSDKDYFKQAELATSYRSVVNEYNQLRGHTYLYMTQVAKYRFSNDENYFTSLADSIGAVTVQDMHSYVANYFVGHAGVRCLYASADTTVPDSLRYYAIDESIKDLTFKYELNIADVDTLAGKQDLYRLIQWLKTNPEVHVQINGYADKGEFTKSYDSTVIKFINNTPSFRKAMPDAVKVNYLRVEMMRAMKIAKALYEAGISEDRIAGTSMTFSSDSPEAAAANRKCTVTLEKIQPRPSLYEYHFGHKKGEPAPEQSK